MELGNTYRFNTAIANFANTAGVASGATEATKFNKQLGVVISECRIQITTNVNSTVNVVASLYKNTGTEVAIATCTIPNTATIGNCYYFTPATNYANSEIIPSTATLRVGISTAGNTAGAGFVDVLLK